MNELYQKSFQTLELDRVLSLLADACATEAGKDLAKALIPATDADDVTKLLQETTDACHMVELKGSPAFRDVKDIKPSLERADRGGALNTRELLRIAVKEYALSGVHGGCAKENVASARVMEKGGMVQYGTEDNGDPLFRFTAKE